MASERTRGSEGTRTRRTSVSSTSRSLAQSPSPSVPLPLPLTSTSTWWSNLSKLTAPELRHVYFSQYKVGSYAHFVSGDSSKYLVPDPMVVLLYGPSGAGKSSLVSTLKRVIEDEVDWNPVAPVNDEEVARSSRTVQTRAYALGAHRARELGRVELWDTRGCWFRGEPERDFANIRDFKLGKLAPGDVAPNLRDALGNDETRLRPVGDLVARPVDLVVFVLDPSSGRADQEHLKEIVKLMIKAEFTYQIVLTKADDYFETWSNVDETHRAKLPLVSADETWCVENYKYNRSKRTRELDRNMLYVFLKLLLAAERSLLSERKRPKTLDLVALIPGLALAFALLALVLFLAYRS